MGEVVPKAAPPMRVSILSLSNEKRKGGIPQTLPSATPTASFLRLYLMPGVKHCAEGPGPDAIGQFGLPAMKESDASHNVFQALEDWVEQNKAPGNHRDQICRGSRSPRRPAQDRDDPPHLPLPATGPLQRNRKHQESRLLRLPVRAVCIVTKAGCPILSKAKHGITTTLRHPIQDSKAWPICQRSPASPGLRRRPRAGRMRRN
jgi:hypothetical protein